MSSTTRHSNRRAFALLLAWATSVFLAACTPGLSPKGIGSATVTRVDASELPGPDGQVGLDQAYRYRIGGSDKLIIDVLDIEQLADRRVTVDGSGNIVLPIAGVVNVGGLTIGEATALISERLRAGFVRAPQVAINIDEAVSDVVTVDGEVKQPGNYPVIHNTTLMRAVASARGATEFAQLREVVIHRTVQGQKMIALYDLHAIRRGAYADPILYPDDVVVVGDSPGRRLLQQIVAISPLFVTPLIAAIDNN
jgi:polysaccharide biosynthesis/export protein